MPKKATNKQKIALLAAALLLLASSIFAARFFLADVYFYQGKRFINKAEARKDHNQQQQQLNTALTYLDKAIALNPHTDYLSLKASSLLWQSDINPATASDALTQATRLYQQALQQRPSDAQLWLGLAESHLLQGQLGQQFSLAITQASRLGFYEALVQKRLLAMAVPVYPRLNANDKAQVRKMYQAAIKVPSNTQELIKLGKNSGLLAWFCATEQGASNHPRPLQKACKKMFGG